MRQNADFVFGAFIAVAIVAIIAVIVIPREPFRNCADPSYFGTTRGGLNVYKCADGRFVESHVVYRGSN